MRQEQRLRAREGGSVVLLQGTQRRGDDERLLCARIRCRVAAAAQIHGSFVALGLQGHSRPRCLSGPCPRGLSCGGSRLLLLQPLLSGEQHRRRKHRSGRHGACAGCAHAVQASRARLAPHGGRPADAGCVEGGAAAEEAAVRQARGGAQRPRAVLAPGQGAVPRRLPGAADGAQPRAGVRGACELAACAAAAVRRRGGRRLSQEVRPLLLGARPDGGRCGKEAVEARGRGAGGAQRPGAAAAAATGSAGGTATLATCGVTGSMCRAAGGTAVGAAACALCGAAAAPAGGPAEAARSLVRPARRTGQLACAARRHRGVERIFAVGRCGAGGRRCSSVACASAQPACNA